ncbi:MAG: DUF488 domain-containing protein [Candidatus Zixiibacteriota bacterium]
MQKVIYTIGTSNRSLKDFISLCREFKLQAVVDVRRFPVSTFDHFKKDNLASHLQKRGVKYFYLGNILGGFREKGYEEHSRTREFIGALERLEEIASGSTTAFMCAEKFPWRCHRNIIASKLRKNEWRVIHILDKEKTWEPENAPTLFDQDT